MALGRIAAPQSQGALVEKSGDEHWLVRLSCCRALAHLGSTEATDALIARLSDERDEVRAAAAESLGQVGDPGAIEPLLNALDDHEIAGQAVSGLKQLVEKAGGQLAAEHLQRLASQKDVKQTQYLVSGDSEQRTGNVHAEGTCTIDCSALRAHAKAALENRG